jgi:hypothetical protein
MQGQPRTASSTLIPIFLFGLAFRLLGSTKSSYLSPKFQRIGLDRCSANELPSKIEGRWATLPPALRIDIFPCCGWDESAIPNIECNAYEHIFQYTSSIVSAKTKHQLSEVGGNGCACSNMTAKQWLPDKCHLPFFEPPRFCELLEKSGKMLLIGDSTMQQFYAIVSNFVMSYCPEWVGFGLSDTLVGREFGVLNRGQTWKKYVLEFDPKWVVLSTGAHFKNTSDFFEVLLEVKRDFQEMKHINFLWRTQNPAGCVNATTLEEYNSFLDAKAIDYGYHKLIERDILTLNAFANTNIKYIDVRPLFLSGGDAHINNDCQHFCINSYGPMGLLPRLLLNAMDAIDDNGKDE